MGCMKFINRIKLIAITVLHYADFASDISVTIKFLTCGQEKWFYVSLLFMVLPLVVLAVLSQGTRARIFALLNLTVFFEFFTSCKHGQQSSEFRQAKYVEALLESFPQLMLQSYVLFFFPNECIIGEADTANLYISILLGLGSITVAVSHQRTQGWCPITVNKKRTSKQPGTSPFFVVILLITACETAVRATSIVYFCAHFQTWLIPVAIYLVSIRFIISYSSRSMKEKKACYGPLKLLHFLGDSMQDTAFIPTEHVMNTWKTWVYCFLFNAETIFIWWVVWTRSVKEFNFTAHLDQITYNGWPWYFVIFGTLLAAFDVGFLLLMFIFILCMCGMESNPKAAENATEGSEASACEQAEEEEEEEDTEDPEMAVAPLPPSLVPNQPASTPAPVWSQSPAEQAATLRKQELERQYQEQQIQIAQQQQQIEMLKRQQQQHSPAQQTSLANPLRPAYGGAPNWGGVVLA